MGVQNNLGWIAVQPKIQIGQQAADSKRQRKECRVKREVFLQDAPLHGHNAVHPFHEVPFLAQVSIVHFEVRIVLNLRLGEWFVHIEVIGSCERTVSDR